MFFYFYLIGKMLVKCGNVLDMQDSYEDTILFAKLKNIDNFYLPALSAREKYLKKELSKCTNNLFSTTKNVDNKIYDSLIVLKNEAYEIIQKTRIVLLDDIIKIGKCLTQIESADEEELELYDKKINRYNTTYAWRNYILEETEFNLYEMINQYMIEINQKVDLELYENIYAKLNQCKDLLIKRVELTYKMLYIATYKLSLKYAIFNARQ